MSRSDAEISICCEGDGCGEVIYYYGPDMSEDAVFNFLYFQGWDANEDLCPKCKKKAAGD